MVGGHGGPATGIRSGGQDLTAAAPAISASGCAWSLQTTKVVTSDHRSTPTAAVLTSTDPTFRVGSAQTFTLDGDIITSAWATFCDARSDGQCGA